MSYGGAVLLSDLVETSAAVGATSARTEKIAALAGALARMAPEEVEIGVAYLSGELRQRQIGVGWASLRDRPAAAADAVADLAGGRRRVRAHRRRESGRARRRCAGRRWPSCSRRATEAEQEFLVRLLLGDLRQGALAGVMTEAVARAAGRAGARRSGGR